MYIVVCFNHSTYFKEVLTVMNLTIITGIDVPSNVIASFSTAIMFTAGLGRREDARSVLDHLIHVIEILLDGNTWECSPTSVVREGVEWLKMYDDGLEGDDPVLIDTCWKVVFIGQSGDPSWKAQVGLRV